MILDAAFTALSRRVWPVMAELPNHAVVPLVKVDTKTQLDRFAEGLW